MKNILIGLILGALLVLAVSSVRAGNVKSIGKFEWFNSFDEVQKIQDGNTVCYVISGGTSGMAISCIRVK